MKNLFIILAFINSLSASDFIVGGQLPTLTYLDQFEKLHTLDSNIHTIIVSFEKATGADMNTFLNEHHADYLTKHHAVFIANISEMPSLITKLFAMPKMRKYKHTILIINDEDNHHFLYKEDKITVYTIENGLIKTVDFVDTSKEVEEKM